MKNNTVKLPRQPQVSSFQASDLFPDGNPGLQLGDAVLHRLLAIVAVWRRDRHDDAGLAHLHPPGEQMYKFFWLVRAEWMDG